MDDTTVSTAALVFTASTVLMGLCFGLLGSIWMIVQRTSAKIPVEHRKIAVNRNTIEDPSLRRRVSALQALSAGCALLAVSILLLLVSMGGVASTMLGFHGVHPTIH